MSVTEGGRRKGRERGMSLDCRRGTSGTVINVPERIQQVFGSISTAVSLHCAEVSTFKPIATLICLNCFPEVQRFHSTLLLQYLVKPPAAMNFFYIEAAIQQVAGHIFGVYQKL